MSVEAEESQDWIGAEVVDPAGEKLGKIAEGYACRIHQRRVAGSGELSDDFCSRPPILEAEADQSDLQRRLRGSVGVACRIARALHQRSVDLTDLGCRVGPTRAARGYRIAAH